MNPARDVALIDQLRAEPAETQWLEFKSNNTDRACCEHIEPAMTGSLGLAPRR